MIIRDLKKEECSRLSEIDPSFVTDKVYSIECIDHISFCIVTKELDEPRDEMPPMFGSMSPSAALWYQDRFDIYEFFIAAEENNRIIGAACVFPLEPALKEEVRFLSMKGERVLAALGVDREHRNRGVGRALLDEVKRRCTESGCTILSLWTGLEYYPAIEFYISQGFRMSGWQSPPGCRFDQCRAYLTWRPGEDSSESNCIGTQMQKEV